MHSFERSIPAALPFDDDDDCVVVAVDVEGAVVLLSEESSMALPLLRMRAMICVSSLFMSSAPRPSHPCDALGTLLGCDRTNKMVC